MNFVLSTSTSNRTHDHTTPQQRQDVQLTAITNNAQSFCLKVVEKALQDLHGRILICGVTILGEE